MRNILFVNTREVSKVRGGIGVMTTLLTENLINVYQCHCFLAYQEACPSGIQLTFFHHSYQLPENDQEVCLSEILIKHEIDTVIIQQMPEIAHMVREIVNHSRNSCQIIYVQHDFLSKYQLKSAKNYLKFLLSYENKGNKLKLAIKICLFPLYGYYYEYLLKKQLGQGFNAADKIVILSARFLQYGKKMITQKNLHKVKAIGNCLTLDCFYDPKKLYDKKKEVLIVSRLEECRKRLLVALKIWNMIEKTKLFPDWKLVIVGDGKHREIYKKKVLEMNLQQISFEGHQPSTIPYYKRASIFIMTSDMEGWGLTLTESLQMGVVPIAFDAFESLHDIIQDGFNGYIIPNDDLEQYADKLTTLMANTELRMNMATKCVASSHRFLVDDVIDEWRKCIGI